MGIKDCNVMIDGQNVFYQAVNSAGAYENIQKITTGNGDDSKIC